jgi:hypothetical protein
LLPQPFRIGLWERLLQSRNDTTETYNAAETGTHAAIDLRRARRPPGRLVLAERFDVVVRAAATFATPVHAAGDAHVLKPTGQFLARCI